MVVKPKNLTPRQKAKRDGILEAARQLFLKQGFASTSTDAIAAQAGISKQTLYSYFPSKEEMLGGVLRSLVEELSRLAQDISTTPFPLEKAAGYNELRQRLEEIVRGLLSILLQPDYLPLVRVIIAETPRFPYLGELFRQTVIDRGFRAITGLLQQAQAQGLIEVPDVEVAARMLVGTLLTFVIVDGLFKPDEVLQPPRPEQLSALIELYLKTLNPLKP